MIKEIKRTTQFKKDQEVMMKKIDFDSLQYHDKTMSTAEALKDVTPIKLDDEIVNGEKKVIITKIEKDKENKCVKLEMVHFTENWLK